MENSDVYFKDLFSLKDGEIHNKFCLLGEGISRRVYDLNNGLVLKLAKPEDGDYQNKVEYYVYTHASPEEKRFLCPIIWFTPRMLIMPKAQPISSVIQEKVLNLRTIRPEPNAFQHIDYFSRRFLMLSEDIESPTSWGCLKGENVLIDYGCTTDLGDMIYDFLFLMSGIK